MRLEQLRVTASVQRMKVRSRFLDVDFTGQLSTLTPGLAGQQQPVILKP